LAASVSIVGVAIFFNPILPSVVIPSTSVNLIAPVLKGANCIGALEPKVKKPPCKSRIEA